MHKSFFSVERPLNPFIIGHHEVPSEVIFPILSFLDFKDLASVSLACRSLYIATDILQLHRGIFESVIVMELELKKPEPWIRYNCCIIS